MAFGDFGDFFEENIIEPTKRAVKDPFSPEGLAALGIGPTSPAFIPGNILSERLFGDPQDIEAPRFDTARLSKEQQDQLERVRGKLLQDIEKEKSLKEQLTQQRLGREDLVNQLLRERLTNIGIGADEARATAGEAASKRNLLRSSFGRRGIEDVTLQEQAQRGEARGTASALIEKGREAERRTRQALAERRERIKTQAELSRLGEIEKELQFLNESQVRANFETELANLTLDQQRKNALIGTLGGFAQAAATLAFL